MFVLSSTDLHSELLFMFMSFLSCPPQEPRLKRSQQVRREKKRFKELLEQNLPSLILIFSDINSFSIQNLMMSGLWEEPVAVQEYWS